jgi:hypothetical protein
MSAKTQTQGVPPRIVILSEARNPLSLRVTNALVSPYPANSKSSRSLLIQKVTSLSKSPFSRFAEMNSPACGTLFGSSAGLTAPSSPRCSVMVDVQSRQSQKYSFTLTVVGLRSGSVSRRKSLPSLRCRNRAGHEGLLHLATITAPIWSVALLSVSSPSRVATVI